MTDNNSKLFEKLQHILEQLTFHAKEGTACRHRIRQFLDEIEFESNSVETMEI